MDSSSTIASNGSKARHGKRSTKRPPPSKTARKNAPLKTNGGHGELLDLNQQQLLNALQAMQAGDFSVRLPGHQTGIAGKIYDTFNTIVSANQRIAQQLE